MRGILEIKKKKKKVPRKTFLISVQEKLAESWLCARPSCPAVQLTLTAAPRSVPPTLPWHKGVKWLISRIQRGWRRASGSLACRPVGAELPACPEGPWEVLSSGQPPSWALPRWPFSSHHWFGGTVSDSDFYQKRQCCVGVPPGIDLPFFFSGIDLIIILFNLETSVAFLLLLLFVDWINESLIIFSWWF